MWAGRNHESYIAPSFFLSPLSHFNNPSIPISVSCHSTCRLYESTQDFIRSTPCGTYRILTRLLIMYVRYRTVVLFTQYNQCHQINSCGPLLAWQHFSSVSYIVYFLSSINFSELIWNREILGPIYRYVTTVRFRCPIILTPPICVNSLISSLCKFNCDSFGLSVRCNDTLVH